MDCEKFDQHVIDALYGDLDELTQAGLERHVEGCSQCGPVYRSLKATRALAVLPLEEAPAALEDRILAAADLQLAAPWHGSAHGSARGRGSPRRTVARVMAWAARPQLAVAAVFFLLVGSSLVVFRGSSMAPGRSAAPALIAADTAAAPEAPTPAATAEAKAIPPAPDPSPEVASQRSADAGQVGGDSPAVEASAAAVASAAGPSVATTRAMAAGRSKPAEAQALADERSRAAPPPPAAKPPARSVGGTNPRAPAAPKRSDAYQ